MPSLLDILLFCYFFQFLRCYLLYVVVVDGKRGVGPSRKLGVLGKVSLASLHQCPLLRWLVLILLTFTAEVSNWCTSWYCQVDSVTSIL